MKLGLIGCENSHANSFAEIFNREKQFERFKITAVGGDYPFENEKLRRDYAVEEIYGDVEEMVKNVDGVIITARDGRTHLKWAEPFIRRGLPCFIDKPFCADYAEAEAFVAEAKKYGALLYGGSSLKLISETRELKLFAENASIKGGIVSAPLLMDSEYGGFYFYASHLVEMSLEIFGFDPVSVFAERKGNDVTATVKYKDFIVCNQFCDKAMNCYFGLAIGKEKNLFKSIDIFSALQEGLRLETIQFIEMIEKGKMPRSYEELIFPVKYMNAVVKSYESNHEVVL